MMTDEKVDFRAEVERWSGMTLRRAMQRRMELRRSMQREQELRPYGDGPGLEDRGAVLSDEGAEQEGDRVLGESISAKEI